MNSLPTVLLKPGEADRVVAGHPWIYQGAILRMTQPPADGDIIQVKDHRQRLLGIGFFNSRSKIHVRMLSSERVDINEPFFEHRIRDALAVLLKHISDDPPPLRSVAPDLPPSLEDVLARALAKEPSKRLRSAGDLARAVEEAWPLSTASAGVAR